MKILDPNDPKVTTIVGPPLPPLCGGEGAAGLTAAEMCAAHHVHVDDPVDHPRHYTSHPSGIECIQVTEHMGFNLGNALKYIWRADLKGDAIEDLRKAAWYLDREISRRENAS